MKKQISPALLFAVIGVAILVIAGIGYRVYNQPPVAANPAVSGSVRQEREAGPTPEQQKQREEWYRQHPEAASGR